MKYFYSVLLAGLVLPFSGRSQFTLNGNATMSSSTADQKCFQLTANAGYNKGSVFSSTTINLSQSFTVNTCMNFGPTDDGGDGIAFVLQNSGPNYIGNEGAGLGYHRWNGICPSDAYVDPANPPVPSFIIEFDTYQNGFIGNANIGDPAGDHVGFMSNSSAYHSCATALKAPEEFPVNIEDGVCHDVTINWNAISKIMTVNFTISTSPLLVKTFTYSGDIVNNLFAGNPNVYWGFTASNGLATATSYTVCIKEERGSCGQLRTQTPGGWGAPPHGNNPASYMYTNFNAAFPTGLVVGRTPNYNIRLTTPLAVTAFLPSGGPAKKLTQNYNNPGNIKNVLAGHLVALSLSVRFDQLDPNFGQAGIQLGQMLIGSGAFNNWTVNDFLAEANKVLGGGTSSYTVQQVLDAASAINENYVDGVTDNHFLKCPTNSSTQTSRSVPTTTEEKPTTTESSFRVSPNPSNGQIEILFRQSGKAQVLVSNANGIVVERRSLPAYTGTQVIRMDLGKYASGIYLVRMISDNGEQVQKILVQK